MSEELQSRPSPHEEEATSECQEYTSFGLGFGVDATNPVPMLNRHGTVRLVLQNLKNVEEATMRESRAYEEVISSAVAFSASVVRQASKISAENRACPVETERDKTREMVARGTKKVTRVVSFKSFCSEEYHLTDSLDVEDSIFEREVCAWIMEEFPDVCSMSGESDAEQVQDYLTKFPDSIDKIIDSVFAFIKAEKVTHYISSITLGAIQYSVNTTMNSTIAICSCSENDEQNLCVGDLSMVERGRGEAVIGYQILPVYMLVRQEAVKKAVQKAVQFYLERQSGPFLIACGANYDRYLKVITTNDKHVLVASDKREEADYFYVEAAGAQSEFSIVYCGHVEKSSPHYNSIDKSVSLRVTANCRFTGRDGGPLEVCSGRGTDFVLQHDSSPCTSTAAWVKEALHVRVTPRLMQRSSYLALSEECMTTMCLPSLSEERRDHTWMRFKLECMIRDPERNRVPVYLTPTAGSQ